MMVRWIGLGCLGSALLFGGCSGKKLSLGELRCEGEGVKCQRPEALHLSPTWGPAEAGDELDGGDALDAGSSSRWNTVEQLPERDVDAMWTVDLPCPNEHCALRGTYAVTHPDGTITVARVIQPPDAPGVESGRVYGGVWLGHFDADGKMVWQDDSLVETSKHQFVMEPSGDGYNIIPVLGHSEAVLALDQDGQVLLGLLRTLIVKDKHGNPAYAFKTEVFRVSEAGEVKRLFGIDDLSELSAIGGVDGDVLLLGDGPDPSHLDAELARYTPSGRLVWRQTALHQARPPAFDESLSTLDMPLVMDSKGRALLATFAGVTQPFAHRGYDAVQVGSDGNIRWIAELLYEQPDIELDREPGSPRLALDSLGRFVMAQGEYEVTRFEQKGATVQQFATEKNRSPILATRTRDEFWDPVVMGLACDASDRVLVVTQSGKKSDRHLLIDRISENFEKRETFVLPRSFVPSYYMPVNGDVDFYALVSNTGGIAMGPDESVYVWTNSALARIALP